MSRSFDIIGNIAILQTKEKLKDMRRFANQLIKNNKNIQGVFFRKKIKGRLRTPKLVWLAGSRKTETIHKESGCLFKLNVATCYFSPRLGTDRLEIARQVKKGERILVMFSGVAPYPIIIAKHSKAKEIYAIELGKEPCKYAEENVKLNKINNIKIIQGNVKKIVPKLKKKFDRIVMARPQLKEDFLEEALGVAKKSTIIHFYDFTKDLNESVEKLNKAAKKTKKILELIGMKKVREIGPYRYHVRIDFKIL